MTDDERAELIMVNRLHQREGDIYQVPPRILQELADHAARKALEEAAPDIAQKAAQLGVKIALDEMKRQAGEGLFQLTKYVVIALVLGLAGWLSLKGKL